MRCICKVSGFRAGRAREEVGERVKGREASAKKREGERKRGRERACLAGHTMCYGRTSPRTTDNLFSKRRIVRLGMAGARNRLSKSYSTVKSARPDLSFAYICVNRVHVNRLVYVRMSDIRISAARVHIHTVPS